MTRARISHKTLYQRWQQIHADLLAYRLDDVGRVLRQTHSRAVAEFGEQSIENAGCLHLLGWYHVQAGEYAAAEPVLRQAQQLCRPDDVATWELWVQVQMVWARSLTEQARFPAAVGVWQEIAKSFADDAQDNVLYAQVLHGLANAQRYVPHHANQAIVQQERAAAICERHLGMQHAQTAWIYMHLAMQYAHQGHWQEAQSIVAHTVPTLTECAGSLHPHTAYAWQEWAVCSAKLGQHELARERFKRASEIFEQSIGLAHPWYAEFLLASAAHHETMGEHEAALMQYQHALMIYVECMGEDFAGTAYAIHKIAILMMNMDETSEE